MNHSEGMKFEIKDKFFSQDLFIATNEINYGGDSIYKAVVSIGCRFFEIEEDFVSASYDVDISIYKKDKIVFYFDANFSDRKNSAKEITRLMNKFSRDFCDQVFNETLNKNKIADIMHTK